MCWMAFLSNGRAQSLSKSQIRGAIAEDRRRSSQPDKIYSIDVASSSEVHIYHTERNKRLEEYNVLRHVHGRWEAGQRMISGSALLVPTQ
jgi:spore cortex formation protein SpoVR/YcgB (stage V sporulation)